MFFIGQEPGQLCLQMGIQTNLTKMLADNSTLEELLKQASNLEVKFRVDKREILTGRGALSKDGTLNILNNSLANEIIQEISSGQKLHFSIEGTATETIQLKGAKEAVQDMRRRLEPEKADR